ncbi:MAG TPA: UMP kinase [Candidatus Nanoarchaeia archaeon]|nr:UMP kinase [Candidatus Nanoarchaeia archaeon]
MATTIISLGGSLINPGEIDLIFLKKLKDLVLDYIKKNRLILVCGGGYPARQYQKAVEHFAGTDEDKDWVGIMATRLNAELVRVIFRDVAYEKVVWNMDEKITTKKNLIIGAGYLPGYTTDHDTTLLAKKFKADLIVNVSNVDYVYDKDPRKHKDAKKIETISWDAFRKLIGDFKPGMHVPFDPVASRYAQNEGMKVAIVNGKDLDNLRKLIEGKPFKGTMIG